MKNLYLLAVLPIILVACASKPAAVVPDAKGVESTSAIGMSCDDPFKLTRDCSEFSGPDKEILMGGQTLKISTNASGDLLAFIADYDDVKRLNRNSNLSYELVKRELLEQGFAIQKVTPIISSSLIFGYAIKTDKPNYHIWDKFAVSEK